MASRNTITSAFAPDLGEVRAWLEKMITALGFVELVAAVLALIGRLRDLNSELVAQLAHLRRAEHGLAGVTRGAGGVRKGR